MIGGGADRLQRTPIAHAEMNALAGIGTGTGLGGATLWSSHRPCMMCAAACEFTGVGVVIFIAPDPSDDDGGEDPDGISSVARSLASMGRSSGNPGFQWQLEMPLPGSIGDPRARWTGQKAVIHHSRRV